MLMFQQSAPPRTDQDINSVWEELKEVKILVERLKIKNQVSCHMYSNVIVWYYTGTCTFVDAQWYCETVLEGYCSST